MRYVAAAASLALACVALLDAPLTARVAAQGFGQREPNNGACFYKDANFRGPYFCINAGDENNAMPLGFNDEISSIRVFGRVEITIFRDEDFRGRAVTINGDVRDLADNGWNDMISSIRVQGDRNGGGFGRGRFGNSGGFGNGGQFGGGQDIPRQGACFYQDANFQGDRFCLARGQSADSMPLTFNDAVSSIQVFGGAQVMIFEHDRFGGQSIRVSTSVRDLSDARSPNGFRWNDQISSVRVF